MTLHRRHAMAGAGMGGRYGRGRSRGLAAGDPERMARRTAHERALGGAGDFGPSRSIRIERRAAVDELRQLRPSGPRRPSFPGRAEAVAPRTTGHAADEFTNAQFESNASAFA